MKRERKDNSAKSKNEQNSESKIESESNSPDPEIESKIEPEPNSPDPEIEAKIEPEPNSPDPEIEAKIEPEPNSPDPELAPETTPPESEPTTEQKSGRKNSAGVKDLTEGKPSSVIFKFALPIFLSQLFQQLYNTADTLIVGQFLDPESLGAVSSSGNLIFLLVSFFTGTAMGAGVVISKYFGAKDDDSVSKAIHTLIAFGIVSGVVLTVAGVIATPYLLRWMNTDKALLPKAEEYFRFYFLGVIATVMYNICRSIMNAVGNSKRPLYYLIFSSLLNIGLDLLFVGAFGWGVWSAAVATVISQAASVVLCFVYLCKKGRLYTVSLKKIKFDKPLLKEMLRYGLPAGIQNSVIGLANVVVQSQINSFGGNATTAYGVYSKIEGFAFLPITSFTMALTTFIGQNLGAGQKDRAKRGARFGIIAAVLTAEVIGFAIYFAAPYLIEMFDKEKTAEIIELGTKQIHTIAFFYFLLAYSHSIAAVCRGAGRSVVPMVIMLCVWCVFRVIYIAVAMSLVDKTVISNIVYIYWAYPITWSISSVIYFIYYHFSGWLSGDSPRRHRHHLKNID